MNAQKMLDTIKTFLKLVVFFTVLSWSCLRCWDNKEPRPGHAQLQFHQGHQAVQAVQGGEGDTPLSEMVITEARAWKVDTGGEMPSHPALGQEH